MLNTEFVSLLCLVFFLIPLSIPTWKWYWISSAIIGLPILLIWTQFISDQSHGGGLGEPLAFALLSLATAAFLAGMLARFLRWLIEENISEIKNKNSTTKSVK